MLRESAWRTVKKSCRLSLFLLVLVPYLATPSAVAEAGVSKAIRIASGLVSGTVLEGNVTEYKGIPFAAPPVGALRWKPPQPAEAWEEARRCTAYGPACPQQKRTALTGLVIETMSEDCLYLNVWTPAAGTEERLPVMVWFHGGGFMIGTASTDTYNGRGLAKHGAVVVTANYRLGPFGFTAHPLLSKESEHGVSGNYGLLDQIAALEWVRDNIAAFGGDPKRVTIFGESGGGRSVAHLMVTPLSEGLFHRGIMQSSSLHRPIQHLREAWYGRPAMETQGEGIARRLGCEDAADPLGMMRQKSFEEILKASNMMRVGVSRQGNYFEPIVDGWVIPEEPTGVFEAGRQRDVPLIAGSCADEGSLFIQAMPLENLEAIQRLVRAAYPKYGNDILSLFPLTTAQEARQAMNHIVGDWLCTFAIRSVVREMEEVSSKAYLYLFTRVRPDARGKRMGAYHGSEIRFVFDNLDLGRTLIEETDRALAGAMSASFVRFAATGDPNGSGIPYWPSFTSVEEAYMEFGNTVQVKKGVRTELCDLFAKIEAERRANRRAQ